MSLKSFAKEYLVKIGFQLDKNSLTQALDAVENGSSKLTNLMTKFGGNYTKAAAGVLGFVASANVGIAKLVTSVADADRATQINARSMWMSVDAYRALESSVEALGYSMSDLSSIAMNPELTGQFRELIQLSQATDAPKDLDRYLLKVRQVSFEFDKMKVLVKSGVRRVVYEFLRMNGVELDNMHQRLQNITSLIQKNLPDITQKIAKVLNVIFQIGKAIFSVIQWVAMLFKKVTDFFTETPKRIIEGITLITTALLVLNPLVTTVILGLTALLLLVDDYMGYKQGKESFFGDKWETIANTLNTLFSIVGWILDRFFDIISGLKEVFSWAAEHVIEGLVSAVDAIKSAFNWVSEHVVEPIKSLWPFNRDKDDEEGQEDNKRGLLTKAGGVVKNAAIGAVKMATPLGQLPSFDWLTSTLKTEKKWIDTISKHYTAVDDTKAATVAGTNNNVKNTFNQNITVKGDLTKENAQTINRNFNRISKSRNMAAVIR